MVSPGAYAFDQSHGQLLLKVFREGVAAKMGHDLVLQVGTWSAKAVVDAEDLSRSTLEASAEVSSFTILEATGGAKPLSRSDRADIKKNIEEKILDARRFPTITFKSTAVTVNGTQATVTGDLTIKGTTRPVDVKMALEGDRVKGGCTVVQSQWGIKPFSVFMGALKVRDTIAIVFDVALPSS